MKRTPPPSAGDIDAVAAAWIGRRDTGLTVEDRRALEQWRNADPRHAEALARFEAAWSNLGRARRTGMSAAVTDELHALERRQRRNRSRLIAGGLAACLAGGLVFLARRSEPSAVPAESAQTLVLLPQRQTLPDGSLAEFPSGTALVVDFSAAQRRVVLGQGEAHFEVVHDSTRPFVVEAGDVGVRAVGTAFAVQRSPSAIEVLVTQGRVAVEQQAPNSRPRELATLDAGKLLVVETSRPGAARSLPLTVQTVTKADLAGRLAWRNPRIEFSGAPLAQVIAAINRHNATKLVLEDADLAATALSGLFRADDTEAIVQMLERGFGVKAERRAGQIILRPAH